MEVEVKQLLTEAVVIGGIVDDFDPLSQLYVIYPNIPISLGDQVWAAEVQHRPLDFKAFCDPAHHSELVEAFRSPTSATVVIYDYAFPGRRTRTRYHGCAYYFIGLEIDRSNAFRNVNRGGCLFLCGAILALTQWQDLVTYEAPWGRRMGTRKIVFTLFMSVNESPPNIIIPESRNNFSTRDFESTNALAPLAAAFFEINYPNENGHQELPM